MRDFIPIALGSIIAILIMVGIELSSIKQELKDANQKLETLHDVLTDIRDNTSEEVDAD